MTGFFNRPAVRKVPFVLGNLVAGFAIIACAGLPAYQFFAERDARIGQQRALLAKLSSVAGRGDDVAEAVQELERRQEGFLVGPNDGVISADLQTRLKRLAESAGARIRSVQGLPPVTADQLGYSASRLEILGSIKSIHRAVHAIESAKLFLFITAASLKISPNAGTHGKKPEEPVLLAQLDIVAAVRTSERGP